MQAPLRDEGLIHEEGSVLTLEELITSKQGRSNIESFLWQYLTDDRIVVHVANQELLSLMIVTMIIISMMSTLFFYLKFY